MKTTFNPSIRTHLFKALLTFFGCLSFVILPSCKKDEIDHDYLMMSSDKFKKPKVKQSVTDVDGNDYTTVKIGNQVWMAENLRTTKFNDGTDIPLMTDNIGWANLTTSGYCWYENDYNTYGIIYGALYNWYSVNSGKLCPAGWHVPTDAEWTILTDFLGGSDLAGGKLKESGISHWWEPNTGSNETGFTALPGGARYGNVNYPPLDGTFRFIGEFGHWWTATELDASDAWYRWILHLSDIVAVADYYKTSGFSVRCLEN